MPTFGWFMLIARPLERVNDERRGESLGIGGFFLMRRTVLDLIGGWNAVKAEVAEDLKLAEILKSSGAVRLRVEAAPELLATRMQTNLREIWEGFSRNMFAGVGFSSARAILGGAGVLLLSVAPAFFGIALSGLKLLGLINLKWSLIFPLLLVWMVQAVTFGFVYRRLDLPARYGWLAPLGHLLFVLVLFNSAWRIASGAGVVWKGRKLYNTESGIAPEKPNREKSKREK